MATAIRTPQKIRARSDWEKRLRFFNGNELQPERSGLVFAGHGYLVSITKDEAMTGVENRDAVAFGADPVGGLG